MPALVLCASLAACDGSDPNAAGGTGFDGGVAVCIDKDGDGYGIDCLSGPDCDDDDRAVTHQCRSCAHPDLGCPCGPDQEPIACFGASEPGEEPQTLVCHEGTRYCRDGVWSGCENLHSYIVSQEAEPELGAAIVNAGMTPETCDPCKRNCFVVKDPLTALDGGVSFADGGGLTLPPGDGGASGSGDPDAGTVTISGGPPAGCTYGQPPDNDCDGIPDAYDELPGSPLASTDNQTIFFKLGQGQTGTADLQIAYQVTNADIYFLLDMTNTMSGERDNLIRDLTSGQFFAPISSADCPDLDDDGLPDNFLKDQGIVGAVRCLIGGAWLGAGYFREVPYSNGDKDEHLFRHLVDMTPDPEPVRTGLRSMKTNGNSNYPEAGAFALWSLATGKGQYFGNDRPAIPERVEGAIGTAPVGCPSNSFGFPCFRKGPIPIVVLFTDDQFENGPGGPNVGSFNINGHSGTDGLAHYTSQFAETFSVATNVGDLRGSHYTFVGDTTKMRSDIPLSVMGCGTQEGGADVVYRFIVSAGANVPARFSLLDDSYDATPATDFPMAMSLYSGIPGALAAPIDIGDVVQYNIDNGPDAAYVTLTGTTAGPGSLRGLLGGISSCGADGATNQVIFTFNPTIDAHVVLDSAASSFGSVLSLHEAVPGQLPPNPALTPITNSNDDFDTATPIIVQDSYRSYVGNTGLTPSLIDADYGAGIVGCGVNPATKDSVFKFDLSTRRRVRIDTEGSTIGTTISLHDGPPEINVVPNVTGNDRLPGQAAGALDGTAYEFQSGGNGTADLTADYTGVACGADDATPDAAYSFTLNAATDVSLWAAGQGTFAPIVALYSGDPGNLITVDASANDNTDEATALDVGSLTAQELTRVELGDTSAGTIAADYTASAVGCSSADASPDAVFAFDVPADTTLFTQVTAATWNATVAVFAGSISAANRVGCEGTESSLFVDVDAGTTYYVVVKGQSAADAGGYTLELMTLYGARYAIDNSGNANEDGDSALTLPEVFQNSIDVTGASTSGMGAEIDSALLGCGSSALAPDAVYHLPVSIATNADIQITPSSWNPVLALLDGPPLPREPVVTLANGNEAFGSAQSVDLSAYRQRFNGNTSGMLHDVDATLIGCGANANAKDAVFSLSVTQPMELNVRTIGGSGTQVIGLFQNAAVSTPASVTLENDTPAAATANPATTPDIVSSWVRYDADLANLTLSSQTPVMLDNSLNDNSSDIAPDQPFDVMDVFGNKITVGGADTSGQTADYTAAVMQCGGVDAAKDAIYELSTTTDTHVRVRTLNNAWDSVVALFDGSTGLPRRKDQLPTTFTQGNTNESISSAQALVGNPPGVGVEEVYNGDTTSMTSDLDGEMFNVPGGATCNADANGRDAFFKFSLTGSTDVEIDAGGSSFSTTLALYDANRADFPLPATPVTMANDTRAAAASNPVGSVLNSWTALTGNMSTLTNSSAAPRTVNNPTNTNETGASALALGVATASAVTVTNGDTTSMANDIVLSCGGHSQTPDAVYSFTTTSGAQLKATASSGAFSPVVAFFDGTPPTGFGYTPSNWSPTDASINWATAKDQVFDCAATSTFNSTSQTFSTWCPGSQPQVLVRSQTGGPDVVILVMRSLRIEGTDTLRLIGDKPVILAVWETADVLGTIDASSYSSGTGAGANYSCGSAAGNGGSLGGGGGGGGFGTKGGSGGNIPLISGGSGGNTRGNSTLVPLIGGCPGSATCGNPNPAGGGAFQISARRALTVTGALKAIGAQGPSNCGLNYGGSGGGSGGGILLESPSITTTTPQLSGGRGGNGISDSGGTGSTSSSNPGNNGNGSLLTLGTGAGGGGYGRYVPNMTGTLPPSSTELSCGAGSASWTYGASATGYLVVKGNAAGGKGAYALDLTAQGTVMGCNEDLSGPDAYFEFTVPAGGRTVTLDTSGSTFDTVLGVYNSSDVLQSCNDNATTGVTWSKLTLPLAAGTYYAVLRPANGAGALGNYQVRIRDDAAFGSIACSDSGSLNATLGAGDYVVGLTGQPSDQKGAYTVRFRDAAQNSFATWLACDTATDTVEYDITAGKPYYVVVKGGAAGQAGSYELEAESAGQVNDIGCNADPLSPDAFYRFELSDETDVQIDTNGSNLDSVIALFPASTTVFDTSSYAIDVDGNPVPCDDDGGTGYASQIQATLAPGAYYVVVKEATSPWLGPDKTFKVSIRDRGRLDALTCAPAASSNTGITQVVDPGVYNVVLSDTGTTGGAYTLQFRDMDGVNSHNGSAVACVQGNQLTASLAANTDYYLAVKGATMSDAGPYSLSVVDADSQSGTAGSVAIDCAADPGVITRNLPSGSYNVLVKGPTATPAGNYSLVMGDVQALQNGNRLACDDDSGPNDTSVIETVLDPGTYYVVVKGDAPGDVGSYRLNVRDLDAVPDYRLACAGLAEGSRIEADIFAGRDYSLVLKGYEGESGDYEVKLYDPDNLSDGGSLIGCTNNNTDLTASLPEGTYYLALKGQRTANKGIYQLDLAHSASGILGNSTYTPQQWSSGTYPVRQALTDAGIIVLPVMSGGSTGVSQARTIAKETGAVDGSGNGLIKQISSNGNGLGADLVQAISELARNLSLNIGVRSVPECGVPSCTAPCGVAGSCPLDAMGNEVYGFDIKITPVDDGACDSPPVAGRLLNCPPGSTPKFDVQITNPVAPLNVRLNQNDIFGGYHFKLEIVGNNQYVLEEIPVYIIPDVSVGPPVPGSVAMTGSYDSDAFGDGCTYFLVEGEGTGDSCADGIDNDGDGLADTNGVDLSSDAGVLLLPPDPDCQVGSCTDGIDNDNDGETDDKDTSCMTNRLPDWTDIFFTASVPADTSITFEACTAESETALDSCTFGTIATITSNGNTCAVDGDCLGVILNGSPADGFCSVDGICQFVDPPTRRNVCPTMQCDDGNYQQFPVHSTCDTSAMECVYSTGPADIAAGLPSGQNLQPYLRTRITLNSDPTASYSPTLHDFWVTYTCTPTL